MKILILFTALLVASVTASGQSLTPVDTSGVWYTNKQDIRCLECLINYPLKERQIAILDSMVVEYQKQVQAGASIIEIQNREIQKQQKRKRLWRSGAIISVGIAVLFALV